MPYIKNVEGAGYQPEPKANHTDVSKKQDPLASIFADSDHVDCFYILLKLRVLRFKVGA